MKDSSLSNATILLIASDPVMRTVLHEILDHAGCLAVAVDSLGPAVDRVKEMRPDLLIVRPYINSMPGAMAAHYLRTFCPGLAVLVVDGFVDDERVHVPLAVEEMEVFPKPFTAREFLDKVKDVLAAFRAKTA